MVKRIPNKTGPAEENSEEKKEKEFYGRHVTQDSFLCNIVDHKKERNAKGNRSSGKPRKVPIPKDAPYG